MVLNLEQFADLGFNISQREDHGDFVVLTATDGNEQPFICVQGVMQGKVLVLPRFD